MRCVLIAGAIGAGKTTVAELLAEAEAGEVVRVRQALATVLGLQNPDRRTLQVEGASLDRRTSGAWLANYLLEHARKPFVVVDAMRTERQVRPILERVSGAQLVYLDASLAIRRRRFREAARHDPLKRSASFERAMDHPTEREVQRLRVFAEMVIETDEMTPSDVVEQIRRSLGLLDV